MKIVRNIKENTPAPQIHVIILGDNNLRSGKEIPYDVIGFFNILIQETRTVPSLQLVFSTAVPMIEDETFFTKIFNDFDQELVKLVDGKAGVSILNLNQEFRLSNGKVIEGFFSDDVHLNNLGSEQLSKTLFLHCNKLIE